MAEPAQKNSSRDAQCAAGGFCMALSVVFRPLVWLIKGLLSVLAAVSHVRDFLVFVAQVSSLPVRMAVYCGMSAVIVFFLLDGGEVGPDGRGHSLTTDDNRPSMKKEL